MPSSYPPGESAVTAFEKLRKLTREAGRNSSEFGIEVWVSPGAGTEQD
jgi:hypothetical protein